ncbi:MAG: hypothetical protein ACOX8Q_09950 [Christensenellales bacterium]|jgi:hypothetical protein
MNLSKEERETSINFTEADMMAIVYTCSKPVMNRMDKLCKNNTMVTVIKQDKYSKTYKVPIPCVLPRNLPMQTDELRAKRAANARRLSVNKKQPK